MAGAGGRRKNPYIIGTPIEERESFFGRESLFRFIEDNLQQNVKVILLHGQRRIGKSSVLKQIPQFFAQIPQNEFVFINFDLQDKTNLSLSQVLHLLATEIFNHLVDYLEPIVYDRVTPPPNADLETDPNIFSRHFLPQVYQELGDKNLVLLLDEFDVLGEDRTQSAQEQFFPYLKGLIDQHERLCIIPVVGRNLGDMPKLLSLFGSPPYQEIGLLEPLSAQRLIHRPSHSILVYDTDATQAILELSAGHPYFTQIICHTLFGQARTENKSQVSSADVNSIIDKAIESAGGGLAWFWDGLPTSEQVVFSAVAEAQKIAISDNQSMPEGPLKLLQSYGVIQTDSLIEATHQLAKKGFLDDTERRVKIELVRRWLVQSHPLQQEILQLETLETLEQQEVNQLWEQATELRQQGRKWNALARYEQIREINPNHFSTVAVLAEGYLELEEFDKAVDLYTQANQVYPNRYQDKLVLALQKSGQKLMNQREFTRADAQFHRILEIEPDNQAAQEKRLEINPALGGTLATTSQTSHSTTPARPWLIPGSIAATVGIISLVGLGVYYRWITPCPAGEEKVFGIICRVDLSRISHGDRTLFPSHKNPTRDQGIEAFKQGKYSEAAKFFKTSVADNRNDPELLIYYNNALAEQQGSPLTLATVVPANKEESTAQEMLRGVAQAQQQFNDTGGINGRLLEIAIANDGNEKDKAQQVAHELTKDSSVLGVIGHNSSDATKAALDEYKRANLPIISPTSTSTLLSGNVFFRTVASNADSGKKLAEHAKNSLRLKKVVIFYDPDSTYSNNMREEFTKNFELGGGNFQLIDLTDSKLDTEKEVAKSLFRYQAQAIVLFPDIKQQDTSIALKIATDLANLMARSSQARKQGLKLLGGNTLYNNKTLQEGGTAVENLILVVPWFREAPQSQNFAQTAVKQWGGEISWRTATSFDATQAFIEALKSPNPSRSTVLQRLPQVNLLSSQTSGDRLQFTGGERQGQPILVKVDKGKFVQLN